MARRLRGVYLITPDDADTSLLLERTESALGAGVALLQYRNKSASPNLRESQAAALHALCQRYSTPLVINDHVELAAQLGCAGAHLGGHDGDLTHARQRLGAQALVGASCYASLDRARAAVTAGASYVAFGTFARSSTKPEAASASPAVLGDAAVLGVPRVAIGGIDAEIAPDLVGAGADLLAVITAVYSASDPAAAVRALRQAFPDLSGVSA